MTPVVVPVTEVNSTEFTVDWIVANGAAVEAGQLLGHAETAKAIYDITAPVSGFIGLRVSISKRGEFQIPIAFIFASADELNAWRNRIAVPSVPAKGSSAPNATIKAVEFAQKHQIDLATLAAGGRLITQKMVEVEITRRIVAHARPSLVPLSAPKGIRRLALIGAGRGASQVIDILAHDKDQQAVVLFDDDAATWDKITYDLPVAGGAEHLKEWFTDGAFDAAIITISTCVAARTKFRRLCSAAGIPLTNAIDPSCRISRSAKIGMGNVLNPFCYVGPHTEIGDNNFFSAYNSIDHHCIVGSDLSTGPGSIISGIVRIGDRVRTGTGVFVQPYLEIGADVQIASGAIIVGNILAGHAVKTKIFTTQITPLH